MTGEKKKRKEKKNIGKAKSYFVTFRNQSVN